MTLVIPPTFYHVTWNLESNIQGDHGSCTAGFKYAGASVGTDYKLLGQAFGELMPSVNDIWAYTDFVVSVQDGAVYAGSDGAGQGGTSHLPSTDNLTFLMHKRSSRPGRSGRGRLFLPGVSEQDVDQGGRIASSKLTELQGNLNDMNAKLQDGHWVWYLLHDSEIKGSTEPTPVTDLSWSPWCGQQDRRMRRGR